MTWEGVGKVVCACRVGKVVCACRVGKVVCVCRAGEGCDGVVWDSVVCLCTDHCKVLLCEI